MKRGVVMLCAVASVALASGCGGGGEQGAAATLATAPTTERTTTSTTLSPEAEVEAAYLQSWDVYTEAVLTFDTSKLADVYDGRALDLVKGEVARLMEANTPLVVEVEHSLDVNLGAAGDALVTDTYVNRNYRVDGTTKEPIDDPNDPGTYVEVYALRKVGESWRVVGIERQSYSPS